MFGHRRILVVDDDDTFRSMLVEQLLSQQEFAVIEAGSAAEALRLLDGNAERVDMLLLDVGLPDADGRDLCARLRRAGVKVPLVMLTGADGEQDVVRGLDAGANDYIVKPFRTSELLARIRAQLRAFEFSEHAEIAIGPFVFRPGVKLLQHGGRGRPTRLTEKEAALLKYLYRAGGRPVSRHMLLREVWGYSPNVATHTVETHIYRLRRKIEPNRSEGQLLVNDGTGYRLLLDASARPAAAHATVRREPIEPIGRAERMSEARPVAA